MSDHYAILGIAPTASSAEVRKAYLRLAREKHPDRFLDPAEKRAAEVAFQELTGAFNVLANERARRDYDQQREKPRATTPAELAEEAFGHGQQFYEARQYYEAAECFKACVHHVPGEGRYQAWLGRALARNPQWAREAAEAFEEALRLEPREIDTYVALAKLYLERGMKLRARKVIEVGLRLRPGHQQLLALAEQARDEPPPQDGGGLRGLLRRKG